MLHRLSNALVKRLERNLGFSIVLETTVRLVRFVARVSHEQSNM